MDVRYFETRAALRDWLSLNHASPDELWIGFYKKASGKPSVTYEEAVEESLCFGWIDGVRYPIDAERFRQRYTRRRRGSNWSAINIQRMQRLIEQGLVAPPGLAAFEARDTAKTEPYSSENREQPLAPEYQQRLKANQQAWTYFEKQPPWYRRTSAFWVMSAKQDATRERRLQQLIDDSAAGVWVGPLRRGQTSRSS